MSKSIVDDTSVVLDEVAFKGLTQAYRYNIGAAVYYRQDVGDERAVARQRSHELRADQIWKRMAREKQTHRLIEAAEAFTRQHLTINGSVRSYSALYIEVML